MKKVCLISLGCEKNLVDSENILALLSKDNFTIVADKEEADVIVINTCGFITSSKEESINTILENILLGKKIVVTGCLVQRYLEDLKKEIPEVDLYIPIKDYYRFNSLLKSLFPDIDENITIKEDERIISTGDFSCYLKIGDGCDNCCTYCAIPLIRGKYKSRPLDNVLKEARLLADSGYKEIVILQQDTTKYGSDLEGEITIVTLLKELLKIEQFEYIRLLYLYPDEISDELIDLIATEERLTPYFDIPIQHSESHILKAMNRRGDKDFLVNLFNKIRNKIPHAILRTTILTGFPSETDEDVENLISFIKEIKFNHLGVFTYSREEDTASYNMPNQIDEKIKIRRKDKIMKAQQKISYKLNKEFVGKEMTGLIYGKEGQYYLFRSYFNAPDDIDGKIYVKFFEPLYPGDKVSVRIISNSIYDLYGEVIENKN